MGAEWTPTNGECFFCHGEAQGYALRDKKGEWQHACWPCCVKNLQDKKEKEETK